MALRMNEHNNGYMALGRYAVWTSEVNNNTKPDLNEAFFVKRERAPGDPLLESGRRFVGPNRWPTISGIPRERADVHRRGGRAGSPPPPRVRRRTRAAAELVRRGVRREPVLVPPVALSARRGGRQSVRHRAAHRCQFPHVPGPDRDPRPPGAHAVRDWVDVPYVPDSFAVNSGDMMTAGRTAASSRHPIAPCRRSAGTATRSRSSWARTSTPSSSACRPARDRRRRRSIRRSPTRTSSSGGTTRTTMRRASKTAPDT